MVAFHNSGATVASFADGCFSQLARNHGNINEQAVTHANYTGTHSVSKGQIKHTY